MKEKDGKAHEFIEAIAKKIRDEFTGYERYHPAILGVESGKKLYDLIRMKRPNIVIETGVCNGFSSSLILRALEENENGKLYSVDLPVKIDEIEGEGKRGAVIPPEKSSGWAVPEDLKDRWSLRIGNTYYELPKIFEEISHDVDIFIHDSGHSYETMMFEFSSAWAHLKEDGLILADNIDMSKAFSHFVDAKSVTPYRLGDMGLFQKK